MIADQGRIVRGPGLKSLRQLRADSVSSEQIPLGLEFRNAPQGDRDLAQDGRSAAVECHALAFRLIQGIEERQADAHRTVLRSR